MLSVEVDKAKGIAIFGPDGPLSKEDFLKAAKTIDPYIEETGLLKGLVIHTESFPGWKSFAALASHLKFVKEHQKKILRIAFVSDSALGRLAEKMAGYFIRAETKGFRFYQLERALEWAEDKGVQPSDPPSRIR